MGRHGFTLTEILIAIAIVGIVSSAAVVNYGVATQRSQFDAARAVLLTIYDGEWRYFNTVSFGTAFRSIGTPVCAAGAAGAACRTDWRNNLGMDNPNMVAGQAVSYGVVAGGVAPNFTFTATATYGAGQTQILNQDREFTGTWVRP